MPGTRGNITKSHDEELFKYSHDPENSVGYLADVYHDSGKRGETLVYNLR